MAPFRQRAVQEQQAFSDIVREVVAVDGYMYFDKIMAEVSKRLLATKQPWASALARSASYRRTLRYAMAKLREGGVIVCEKAGPDTRWYPTRRDEHASVS